MAGLGAESSRRAEGAVRAMRLFSYGLLVAAVACNDAAAPDPATAPYRGPIVSVQGARLLVQYAPETNATSGRVQVTVTGSTRILGADGRVRDFTGFRVGESVAVWAAFEMRSDPLQVEATVIRMLGDE